MYSSTAYTCLLDIDYSTCYITLRDLYLVGSVYSVLIAYLKWLCTANLPTVIGAYFESVHQVESVCKKTQGFVGFNPLGSEEANISKTETE